jgi:hypothetical protein
VRAGDRLGKWLIAVDLDAKGHLRGLTGMMAAPALLARADEVI